MTCQFRPSYFRLGTLFLSILLLFGLVISVHTTFAASDEGWDENIELTGSFHGTFTLDTNTSQLFRVDDAVPGDSWSGDITIRNNTDGPMEIALLTIESELEDLSLYNALTLDLEIAGETLYSGTYGETPSQITPYYVVPAGNSVILNATVGFPSHYGNEMLNKIMDSVWTFEARHQGEIESAFPNMCPYTVYYIDKDTKESLLPKKESYAASGSEVTEYAPSIEGYSPDSEQKSITIQETGNKILFFYEKKGGASELPSDVSSGTSDPSKRPSDVAEGVKTGHDMSQSNTLPVIYGVLAVLCGFAVVITWLRIRAQQRRSNM